MSRSTSEVFEDHLRRRTAGDLDGDLEHNYAADVVMLCEHGAFRGHDALRKSAEQLAAQLPEGKFEYVAKSVEGEYALVVWRATSSSNRVEHGADSFVVRDGRI